MRRAYSENILSGGDDAFAIKETPYQLLIIPGCAHQDRRGYPANPNLQRGFGGDPIRVGKAPGWSS
jgi:hypothetical protein